MKTSSKLLVCLILMTFELYDVHGDAGSDLASLVKDYYEWRMADRPEISTYRDFHKYNDVLESFLESDFDTRKARADTFLIGLNDIPRGDLTKADKLSYDILENMLTTYIAGYPWRYYNNINPLNLLDGPQRNPSIFTGEFPFFTVGDFENYLSRLSRFLTQLDQRMDLMRLAITKKTAYHLVSMNLVLEQIAAICPSSNYSIDCTYYKPFEDALDLIRVTSGTRNSIRIKGETAIRELKTKYQELSTFIQDEYLPETRKHYGVVNLVNGREYYQACLKWYLALDLTPEDVHQRGRDEVARIEKEMKKIMAKQNFDGTVAEFFTHLKKNSSMFFNTAEEMLAEYEHMVNDRIDPFLDTLFTDLPNLPLRIKAMPSDGPAGRYSRASADGSRPGIFYANVLRPHEFPKILMMPLTMHEASPGHHLQLSYNAKTTVPDFRSQMETSPKFHVPFSFPSYTAFTEGWALYAESLGEEMKLYKDDNELMGRYSSEMFRACRLVVDTGIHYYNWTKDEAVEYIANYTSKSIADITVEVDRYVTWPGQACSYKIGELKIKELRNTAATKLGDTFDVKEFHTSIMKSGIVPLNLLERNVNDWIEEQLNGDKPTDSPVTCSADINSIQTSLVSSFFIVLYFILK